MECLRHPGTGTVIIGGDMEVCYGCYEEQFDFCPLCGRRWEEHPPDDIDCRKARLEQGGENVNRKGQSASGRMAKPREQDDRRRLGTVGKKD